MLPCCVALSCRPKCPAIAGSLFSEHLVADIPRNCNRLPQLEIERDFSTSVEMTRWQTWGAYRHSNHIDRKLTLKPAEAGASSGSPMDALLTGKSVKFIGSEVERAASLWFSAACRKLSHSAGYYCPSGIR